MIIKKGDIFLANLNPVKGHEQAGFRPVLVLQNNVLNQHLSTVLIAPITKNLKAKDLLTTYFLNKKISKLKEDSVVLLFQLRAIDKFRLEKKLSRLSDFQLREVKTQIALLF